MAKSWKEKKKNMDDLFDRLLENAYNHPRVTDPVDFKNNASSSESESEDSSSEVLFRSPQPVGNYSNKRGATSATTKEPAVNGVVSQSHLTASTPQALKNTTSHYEPDLSPIAADEKYKSKWIHRYVNLRKTIKEQAKKEKSAFSYPLPSPEIKEKPEEERLCSPDESCVIIKSHHSSPGSSNRLRGYDSNPLLLLNGVAEPETNPSDPERWLALTTRHPVEASGHASCRRLPLNASVCEEDRKRTEAEFSVSNVLTQSPPRQRTYPNMSLITDDFLSSCERLCKQLRGDVPEDALAASISPSSLQAVQPGYKTSSTSASTCTSVEDKVSQDPEIEVKCTKSPECLLASPVVPGKKYRRSLGFQNSVKNSRHTEAVVTTAPRVVGRKSCFAIHGLLPYCNVSKRKSTIVRAPLPAFFENVSEEAGELKEEEEDIQDGEKRVLRYCNSSEIISFEHLVDKKMGRKVKKIGEGFYGEVFGVTVGRNQQVVKILPVNGEELCNGEPQKKFEEVLSELMISKALSDLNSKTYKNRTENFARLTNVHLVRGEYPPVLLNCWDEFDAQEGSENWRPEFPIDQRYLVLGLEHGGEALEKIEVMTKKEAGSIFLQIAYTLAVAEVQLQFEHRDLHVGNVLVKKSRKKKIPFMINGNPIQVPCNGYVVTIIDFTLSRAQIGPNLVFCDLSKDDVLFEGSGDYQFDIYRLMRENNNNDWSTFHPRSNALWLHYLGKKLLGKLQEQSQPSLMHQYLTAVWEASSAASFVQDYVPNMEWLEL